MDFYLTYLLGFIFVFMRMGGLIFFNPVFTYSTFPSRIRAGLALMLAIIVTPTLTDQMPVDLTDFEVLLVMSQELMVGFTCGMCFQIYYYMLHAAGSTVDMNIGMAMAKIMDPGTGLQSSFSEKIFHWMFTLFFFITDGHLILIRAVAKSYEVSPIGQAIVGHDAITYILELFPMVFAMVVQLTLPFISAIFILEMAMGILMKLVPQISIFSIHFQLKILIGLCLLFLFSRPISEFMQNYLNETLLSIGELLSLL